MKPLRAESPRIPAEIPAIDANDVRLSKNNKKKRQELYITEIKTNWIHFNVQGLYYKGNGERTLFIAMACSVCSFLDYLSKSAVCFCWKLHYLIQSFQNKPLAVAFHVNFLFAMSL